MKTGNLIYANVDVTRVAALIAPTIVEVVQEAVPTVRKNNKNQQNKNDQSQDKLQDFSAPAVILTTVPVMADYLLVEKPIEGMIAWNYSIHELMKYTRFAWEVVTGTSGTSVQLVPPKVVKIDAKQGIVYFENPTGEQIEVYKYTRKKNRVHKKNKNKNKEYSPHLGKRYKVLYQLKKDATSWKVPDKWIYPVKIKGKINYRSHFKFGVRKLNGIRSDLSALTVLTANSYEYNDGVKIILENCGGGGKRVIK